MALVPSKRWTAKDVLSLVRELTKTVDQQKVLVEQGKYFYNVAISEIVSMLNGSLDPTYFVSETISLAADVVINKDTTDTGNITQIDTNTSVKTITFNSSPNNNLLVGQLVVLSIWTTGGAFTGLWAARIVSKGTTTSTYLTISGTEPAGATYTTASYGMSVAAIGSAALYSSSFTVSTLTYTPDRIVEILDSTYGTCVRVSLSEFFSIGRSGFSHKSYDDDIIWTQTGTTIYFRKGAKILSEGTKTIIYQRQPIYPTNYDDTDYVDLSDKHIPLLVKRIYTYVILQVENDIPKNLAAEMQLDYAQLSAAATAELQNKYKKTTMSGRPQE